MEAMVYREYSYEILSVYLCCTFGTRVLHFSGTVFSICLQGDIREGNSFISYINRVIPLGTGDDGSIHETEIGETTSGRRTLFPRFYNMFRGFVRA